VDEILLKPIGKVKSSITESKEMPRGGKAAVIEIFEPYTAALLKLEENSHIWVLSWFHKADRDMLVGSPLNRNPEKPEYGAFAMRSPSRPNPVAITLTRLLEIDNNRLYVERIDAIDGTPVIDIKPYFENDIIFSPRTPYFPPRDGEQLQAMFMRQALSHHQELCPELQIGVRMATLASNTFGHLNTPDLFIHVLGPPCLADTIQGLSRARLANPPRFSYHVDEDSLESHWSQGERHLSIMLKPNVNMERIMDLDEEELFVIETWKSQ